jgi:hypothetical protein
VEGFGIRFRVLDFSFFFIYIFFQILGELSGPIHACTMMYGTGQFRVERLAPYETGHFQFEWLVLPGNPLEPGQLTDSTGSGLVLRTLV